MCSTLPEQSVQGKYFSPVGLSLVAHQQDEGERMRTAGGGVTSQDCRTVSQGDLPDCEAHQLQTEADDQGQQMHWLKLAGGESAQSKSKETLQQTWSKS